MYLIEITYNGSVVLIMCVVGVWRHMPIKYSSSLPDDGSILCDPKHVGVHFNLCLLEFYIT